MCPGAQRELWAVSVGEMPGLRYIIAHDTPPFVLFHRCGRRP